MQKLGIGAYRFSVAWPRVMPEGRGAINEAGLAFYDRLIDSLIASGIEPWLCLYHWDLPQALQENGGWANRDCAQWFADYTDVIARRYGDRVKRFATFNEPSVFTLFAYCLGGQPPGIVDRAMLLRAIHHVNLGTAPRSIACGRASWTPRLAPSTIASPAGRRPTSRKTGPRRTCSTPIGTARSPIRSCAAFIRRSWRKR